jgi:single-strand DNA-binding protein
VWGAQGENCAKYLVKGRPVAIDGRLRWESWDAKDGSGKRSKVKIVADNVQFLGDGKGGNDARPAQTQADMTPAAGSDFGVPAGGSSGGVVTGDDDIPF